MKDRLTVEIDIQAIARDIVAALLDGSTTEDSYVPEWAEPMSREK